MNTGSEAKRVPKRSRSSLNVVHRLLQHFRYRCSVTTFVNCIYVSSTTPAVSFGLWSEKSAEAILFAAF